MAEPEEHRTAAPPGRGGPEPWREVAGARPGRLERRRQRIREELARNRRGEHLVPTWLLTALLVLVVAAVAAFLAFG
ncbi:MAG TPA: hypothetical protein VNV66_10790 [Pilimelia sp.]|nr:hypothetical protein [Pilimelia sp.]